ncbi:MAG: hypothetical protein ACYC7D_15280 [Nitrososphaerales archaeon]
MAHKMLNLDIDTIAKNVERSGSENHREVFDAHIHVTLTTLRPLLTRSGSGDPCTHDQSLVFMSVLALIANQLLCVFAKISVIEHVLKDKSRLRVIEDLDALQLEIIKGCTSGLYPSKWKNPLCNMR